MDTSAYWEFLVLSEAKNYSEAAFQLSMSESSLSRHIRSMEFELGVTLFQRSSRSVTLTEYGEAFIPYVKKILALQSEYRNKFHEISNQHNNALKIRSYYDIRGMLDAYCKAYPGISVLYDRERKVDKEHILQELDSGESDIIFDISDMNYDEHIKVTPYLDDVFSAVISQTHPLASCSSIHLSQLAHEDFIALNTHGHELNDLIENCHKSGFNPNIICIANDSNGVAALVKYHGVSLLLKKLVTQDNFPGVAVVDLLPSITVKVKALSLKSRSNEPEIRSLLDFIANQPDV